MWAICKRILGWAALVAFCAVALFGESATSGSSPAWLRSVLAEIRAACRDPGTQWMVFACCAIYFVAFTTLLKRGARNAERGKTCTLQHSTFNLFYDADFWLCGLLLISSLHYAFNYDTASGSTQALMLLAGAAIGKGARLWANWGILKRPTSNIQHPTSNAEIGDSTPHPQSLSPVEAEWEENVANVQRSTCNPQLLLSVLLLQAAASLWHPETAMQFQYRGLNRWSGPWDNPNIFGLLMGTGVVIGAGLLVAGCKLQVARSDSPPGRGKGWVRWLWRLLLFACLACCAVGLLKSYSRGAWLGTALGLAMLGFRAVGQAFQPAGSPDFSVRCSEPADRNVRHTLPRFSHGSSGSRFISWLGRNRLPLAVLLASVLVLGYWQFRYTEFHPVRRVFSVGNQNDFSWRNRVAAWEGSLAMMADRPLTGFGWNKPERIYDQYYRQPKVSEGMAIQLNHYFILGMSLGVPALLCFAAYIGLSLTQGRACHSVRAETDEPEVGAQGADAPYPQTSSAPPSSDLCRLSAVCCSAAVVLLIGLWFDGGLFTLATASLFWVLLELGRVTPSTLRSSATEDGCAPVRGIISEGDNP